MKRTEELKRKGKKTSNGGGIHRSKGKKWKLSASLR